MYVNGNMLQSNLSAQYLSDKIPLVMFISATSYLMNKILLNASAMSLSGSFIYLIIGKYYNNIKRQKSIISVVKCSCVNFLWFVYRIVRGPKN